MNVGETIKTRRKGKKLTQKQLSSLTGLKQATISAIESGRNQPTIASAQLLANALDCTVDELMSETEKENEGGLAWEEKKLIADFRALNSIGKEKVLSYIADLLDMPKYTEETLLPSQLV